ncbi:hypothetical protein FNV43_RR18444 [Rhamnella rubrinervis]|uniref:Uncharacterized protein n=1 Tax=Rhamnella rubrinervis TaxID=2594499 RepID=A0A8K0DZE7_9ROSA|nr:hypothetical protein FNV43_RR18444 [Rhamnella rubrinervis]
MNIIAVNTGGISGANIPILPPNETAPAVLVFGDSVVDTGNNNYVQSVFPVRCDFPPYGKDFNGGKPTGRYSNGRVPSDMLAEILNVKKLLPPYLDPNLKLQDLLTGVTFASGANGYDPLTSKTASVLSLSDQLKLFKEYKAKLMAAVGETKTESIVSKSVYLLCTGSNDITNTYFSTPFRRPHYDVPAYTDLMLQSATTFLQELYGEGARRIGVVSLPPIGCLPSQRTLRGGLPRECTEPLNQAAILFNSKLSSQLLSLNQTLPRSTFFYLDIYNPLLSLIQDPSNYGFEEATKGCCGTGTIEWLLEATLHHSTRVWFRALVATMGHNPPLRIHTTACGGEIPPPLWNHLYIDLAMPPVVITTIAMNPISRCFNQEEIDNGTQAGRYQQQRGHHEYKLKMDIPMFDGKTDIEGILDGFKPLKLVLNIWRFLLTSKLNTWPTSLKQELLPGGINYNPNDDDKGKNPSILEENERASTRSILAN